MRRIAFYYLTLFCVMLAFPHLSVSETVESDPSVVSVLPKHYPLNRVRVAAEKYPWSAVGLLTALGGRIRCTGSLVAESYVLTAAHCVFRVRHFPKEINFLAGYELDRYVAHSKAKKVHIDEAFKNDSPSPDVFATDWALIELEKPIGQVAGYLGWASFDADVFAGMQRDSRIFKVSGYRGDRRFVQTVDHRCQIAGFAFDDRLIEHQCPIRDGDSGGPILLPYREHLFVVGIDVGSRGKRNGYAVPLATVRSRLSELGMHSRALPEPAGFVGRFGSLPKQKSGGH